MNREEKIRLANELKENVGWKFFRDEMDKLLELKNGEISAAMSRNAEYAGIYAAGFKLGIETALNFPERTIKINQTILKKIQEQIEEALT